MFESCSRSVEGFNADVDRVDHFERKFGGVSSLPSKKTMMSLFPQKLGLQEEQAEKLFQLSAHTWTHSAIRIANEPSALWSHQEGGNLIAQASVLKKVFNDTTKTVPLEVRLAVPSFSFGETKNSSDNGNLKLAVNVWISKEGEDFNYSARSVEIQGLAPFDKNEAIECSKMKSLVPQMFAGVSPSPRFQYGGWDQVLSRLAREALDQNKNIRSELDPSNGTRIVGIVADHLEALMTETTHTRNMNQSKDSVLQMGLDWSFKGNVVSSARIGQILQAVDHSIDTFKVSSVLEGC